MKSLGGYVKRRMPARHDDFKEKPKRANSGGQIYQART
jgi:hypothetical protein